MKKYIPTILAGAASVLLVISLIQNYEMKQQMEEMERNLQDRIYRLEQTMNGIEWNIDAKLEEEASLLADSSWSYGAADMEAMTVALICQVTPKEYQPAMTTAYVKCDGVSYPMTLENGIYTAEIPTGLFEESCVEQVRFEDNGVTRVETLDWNLSPRNEFLPTVYVDFAGGSTGSKKDGAYVRTFDGEALIQIDYKDDIKQAKAIEMVELIDGEEIRRTDIPVGTYRYEMDQTVTVPLGSSYGIYFEITDLYDLHHRCWVWYETIDENGNVNDDPLDLWRGSEGSIYSADGEPLSVADEEFYQ